MRKSNRILVAVVLVISALMLVASLAGVVGVWFLRAQLNMSVDWLAGQAEARVDRVQQGLDQMDTALTGATDQLAALEEDLQAFGDDVETNRPLFTALAERLDLGILPLLGEVRDTLDTVLEAVDSANATIDSLNALPFVSIPAAELARIENLAGTLDDLDAQVQALRTTVDTRRSEIVQGSVTVISTPTAGVAAAIVDFQGRVSGFSDKLDLLLVRLADFRKTIGHWLTGIAVVATLTLLWAAFSQGVLLVLGWRSFKGQVLP